MKRRILTLALCVPLLSGVARNLTTFVDLVKSSPGVKSAFTDPGPTTVFAPSDAAFAKLPNKEFPVTGSGKALKIGAASVVKADSVLPSE
jgi:Fasciclin domain